MEEQWDWGARLVGLLALLWIVGHPWMAMTYLKLENALVGVWVILGWIAGGYGLLKMTEALLDGALTPEEKLMKAVRKYSEETGKQVAITWLERSESP